MKKAVVVFTSLTLIFLLGCSAIEDKSSEKQIIEETTYEENIDIDKYEELNNIKEIINLEDYNINVESDNKGTRIILFEKNEKKIYKSIFVKEKRHLKLIDLQSNEKPLINETI
ncbi:hypothetical protein H9660_09550 [Clostridium sp. Sa3CUN1]|uniref:Lipoprotein n=1 Tax=Clostridium gallinarum TaxID=2762246 RepID=A0ABR8Q4N6_9CLOT|nr:hypothetical protein [Clostridium gallinarum]MBD7915392.1 hypothetical protein [Clostridium gallinarum]